MTASNYKVHIKWVDTGAANGVYMPLKGSTNMDGSGTIVDNVCTVTTNTNY